MATPVAPHPSLACSATPPGWPRPTIWLEQLTGASVAITVRAGQRATQNLQIAK